MSKLKAANFATKIGYSLAERTALNYPITLNATMLVVVVVVQGNAGRQLLKEKRSTGNNKENMKMTKESQIDRG